MYVIQYGILKWVNGNINGSPCGERLTGHRKSLLPIQGILQIYPFIKDGSSPYHPQIPHPDLQRRG